MLRTTICCLGFLGCWSLALAADQENTQTTAEKTSADTSTPTSGFEGWQGLRVISQEGMANRLLAADLNGDGHEQLIVVNTRQSRLEFYRWLSPDQRKPGAAPDADRPNELPLAADWSRTELPLDDLPLDVVVQDLDADNHPELIILGAPGNKLSAYKQESTDQWKKWESWELLPGSLAGRTPLLVRKLPNDKWELLASMEGGVQTLLLAHGSRPAWLSPREGHGRFDWSLVDVDGDGDLDLLEWSSQPLQSIRWYECREGALLPAQVAFDQQISGFSLLPRAGSPAELLLLGGTQEGLFRRQTLGRGAEHELGRRDSLPIAGGESALWCGLVLDGRPALVSVDAGQPRFRVQGLGEQGWLGEQTFPSIGDVKALAAPQSQAGTLLLWGKDAGDLHVSRWQEGRLSYPMLFNPVDSPDAKKILRLDTAGGVVWWVQRVGADLDLFVWDAGQPEPVRTHFAGIGTSVEGVSWLGGQRLLLKEEYANGAKLAWLENDELKTSEPAHLAKVEMTEFGLVGVGENGAMPGATSADLRPVRFTEGVMQWLGPDLQPTDQIMLSEGQRMASYVPLAAGEAWALEQGGQYLHRLKPDEAKIPRVTDSVKINGGLAIRNDPALGLMVIEQDRITRVSRGSPWELKLIESLDGRIGRPSGVKEATIHRLLTTDVDGDNALDVVLCDDIRHQLTVLSRTEQGLKPLISWPVFEDRTYPYGGVEGSQVSEPRWVVGFDADGDSRQDLALVCHDRLLIYIAKETP